jgi:hypothetical protein
MAPLLEPQFQVEHPPALSKLPNSEMVALAI